MQQKAALHDLVDLLLRAAELGLVVDPVGLREGIEAVLRGEPEILETVLGLKPDSGHSFRVLP